MKKLILPFTILSLISTIIFSVLTSNSYVYFVENKDKLFIEDIVIVKVLDGEIYTTVDDVNEMLQKNFDNYVMYAKDNNTIYVHNNNYDRMLYLEQKDGKIVETVSGDITFKQLDLKDTQIKEVFVAVKGVSDEELTNAFANPNNGYPDGSIARFTQQYKGMISLKIYISLVINLIIINVLFVMLYFNTYKEKIGVMKVLGYNTKSITISFMKNIVIMYIVSVLVVYLINYEYINFMFTQSYVFSQIISLLITYVLTIIVSIIISGIVIYYSISKTTVTQFLKEVSYD